MTTTSPPTPAVPLSASATAKTWSRPVALWLLASIVMMFLAASSAPSPLYGLYRAAWGFSALSLTLVFSSYALALLAALLLFGGLSDHRGRREVVLVALALEAGSVLLFWHADSIAWLFAARVLQGVATGIATSALSAALIDLNRERGALVNSVAPMFGMALGALGTSALVQFAGNPTRLVFEVLLLVFAAQALAVLYLPETVTPRAGAWASMRPRIAVPAAAWPTMWQVLPINTAQWALGGFYLSLGPTLARTVLPGSTAPMIGGGLIAALVLSGALAILAVRQRPAARVLAAGAALLLIGLAVTLAGVQWHSAAALFGGTVIAGLGFGGAFNASVRSLVPLAAAHERASLMSSFFVLSYLAFSLPAIVAGLAVGFFGLQATALGYGFALIATTAAALVMMAARRSPGA